MSTVLRGGRLRAKTRKDVVKFISSLDADRRIAKSIVLVNEAHTAALRKAGIVSKPEEDRITRELRRLENRFPTGGVGEDFHLYIEQQLTARLGELGGKIHTGKSRNDQVATAIRMMLRMELLDLSKNIIGFAQVLLRQAQRYRDAFFVGYTHMQPAQPTGYGHYLLSIVDALLRDLDRISETFQRVNLSPMGSGAIAGSSFPLDRRFVADLLGFEGLVEDSLDGVGSRDFLLETLGVCVLISTDLSRVAQDWILYGSSDVDLIELPDEYSSTSSIMPQKKNPDPLEIIRAQSAETVGSYTSAATILHALPSGYNLDFQQVTPIVWTTLDRLRNGLSILTGMAGKIRPVPGTSNRYQVQFTVATELANTLVRLLGMPFRDAYNCVGRAVRLALKDHRTLQQLTRAEWSGIIDHEVSEKTYSEMRAVSNPSAHSRVYRTLGSPNGKEVERMLRTRRAVLKTQESNLSMLERKIRGKKRID